MVIFRDYFLEKTILTHLCLVPASFKILPIPNENYVFLKFSDYYFNIYVLKFTVYTSNANPINWWNLNQIIFSQLVPIAPKYLGILASLG